MKKFSVMILLVSTFFLGLGSLIDNAGARFKSDPQALELIRLSRVAIGGDANINNVRSLSVNASTTNPFEKKGAVFSETGSLELNLQLPNQFSKMVRIGMPGGEGDVEKRIEVRIVKDKDGHVLTEDIVGGEPRVMKTKTGDGENVWVDDKGNVANIDGDKKIIIRTDGGTTENIIGGDKNVIIMNGDKDGEHVWNSKDSKEMHVEKEVRIESKSGGGNDELLKTTLSLLLSAPQGTDITYTMGGEGSVDGFLCNIVVATSGASAFKLFLDRSTFLPRMISYDSISHPHVMFMKKSVGGEVTKEKIMEVKTSMPEGKMVEHQLKLTDYRTVGGLLLPFSWTESIGGKVSQTVSVTNFDINPANIADKFKDDKIIVRAMKENKN